MLVCPSIHDALNVQNIVNVQSLQNICEMAVLSVHFHGLESGSMDTNVTYNQERTDRLDAHAEIAGAQTIFCGSISTNRSGADKLTACWSGHPRPTRGKTLVQAAEIR